MSSTTTIRLPDELKAQVARAAHDAGTTPHGFILAAIAEKADEHELRVKFETIAAQRYEKFLTDGKSIAWTEVRSYLESRVAGKLPPRPRAQREAGYKSW